MIGMLDLDRGKEGLFMVCPFGQSTGFKRVGRTFGTAL